MLVLGGGPVGCEFTHLLSAFGSRVVLADRNPRLVHREDPEVGDFLADRFRRRGVDVRLRTAVTRVDRVPGGKQVALSPGDEPIVVDEILVAIGQAPQHRPRPRRRRNRARQARDHRGRDAPDHECASLRRRRRRRPAPLHPRRLLSGPGGVREHVRLAPPPGGLPRHAPLRVHLAGGGGGGADRAGGPRGGHHRARGAREHGATTIAPSPRAAGTDSSRSSPTATDGSWAAPSSPSGAARSLRSWRWPSPSAPPRRSSPEPCTPFRRTARRW